MRWTSFILPVAVVLLIVTLASNLGGSGAEGSGPAAGPVTPAPGTAGGAATATPDSAPVATPAPDAPPTLTPEELAEYQPNELGQIPVLMYHEIGDQDDVWVRKPEAFRQDLQWLYDHGFYVIPIRDYIHNRIQAPPGKRPVVLAFDDGTVSQFRYVIGAGGVEIDPNSAVGILEEFFTRYDDFGRGGLFSILPLAPFAWPDAEDQRPYAQRKLQFLIDNGYELGNHTVGHVNMREISAEELKAELAGAVDMIQEYVPQAEIEVIAVTFGIYPAGGDTTLFEGFAYEGRHYRHSGALMVGANPALSPNHVDFDPYWIPRIRADDEELGKWFAYLEQNPGVVYVSDGNPDTVAIPEDLHPSLVGTLDEEKTRGKTIIRY